MGSKRYFYCFLISISIFGCIIDNKKKEIVKKDTIIVNNKQIIEYTFLDLEPIENKQTTKTYEDKLLSICRKLNGISETKYNSSYEIDKIISKSGYPLKSQYCGILVNYVLSKAGIKHNVRDFGKAASWFKDPQQTIVKRGKFIGLDRNIKVGYVVGMSFDSKRDISHVGIYIKDIDAFVIVETFEGNTSLNNNRNKQGISFKQRKFNILWLRKI